MTKKKVPECAVEITKTDIYVTMAVFGSQNADTQVPLRQRHGPL